ncbi:hypothetical protein PMAYCL1PPCAC_20282, partial [Pristionchus mayeri]
MKDVRVNNFRIKSRNLSSKSISQFIKAISAASEVKKLTMYIWKVHTVCPAELLLKLSSLVPTIAIYQNRVRGKNYAYFFGAENVDWQPVIVEMFSNKIDKLYISNPHHSGFICENDANKLRK